MAGFASSSNSSARFLPPGRYRVEVLRIPVGEAVTIDVEVASILRTRMLTHPDVAIIEVLVPVQDNGRDPTDGE